MSVSIVEIPLEELRRDFGLYPRDGVDGPTIHRFKLALLSGAVFPPIRVCTKSMRIVDGFHRFAAHQELNRATIAAVAEEGVERDGEFFLRAVEANKAHGLGYSAVDHNKIIEISKRLNLHREKIALAMSVPVQKLENLKRVAPEMTGVPLPITHKVKTYPRPTGTPAVKASYVFHFNQVIAYLKSGMYDTENHMIVDKAHELETLLIDVLNKADARC